MNIFLFLVVVVIVIIIFIYNGLVGKKNEVNNVYGGIEAILKKRYNVIPNLVQTVMEYARHEQGVLEKITEYRSRAIRTNDKHEENSLNSKLSSMLSGIMVSVENYPELKANVNFMHLQKTLLELEAQISASRRAYNQTVTDYNNAIEMFPSNIVANFLDYKRKNIFEVEDDSQRENPDLKNLFNS